MHFWLEGLVFLPEQLANFANKHDLRPSEFVIVEHDEVGVGMEIIYYSEKELEK